MLIHYFKTYRRKPPYFKLEPIRDYNGMVRLPEGLLEVRGLPYQELADGYAWITRTCAQRIYFDEKGKIEVVIEYYEHSWVESHFRPGDPQYGKELTQEEKEWEQILGSASELVYSLPDHNNCILYFRLPHQMNRTLEEDRQLPEALWPENCWK